MNETPTPRTDNEIASAWNEVHPILVRAEFARQLERELAEANRVKLDHFENLQLAKQENVQLRATVERQRLELAETKDKMRRIGYVEDASRQLELMREDNQRVKQELAAERAELARRGKELARVILEREKWRVRAEYPSALARRNNAADQAQPPREPKS